MNFLRSIELKTWLKNSHNRILLVSVFVLILALIVVSSWKSDDVKPDPLQADTVIPAGFVLVPIELANSATIGSLMGSFGIVDLFTVRTHSETSRRVAHNVRLIRAPLNPDQFAALSPEAEAPLLLQSQGPLFAVLQNPEQNQKSIFKNKNSAHSRVEYFSEK